jgi:multidrug efflux system outer membrane protein
MRFFNKIILMMFVLCFANCSKDREFKNHLKGEISSQFLSDSKDINSGDVADKWWLEFNDHLLNKLVAVGLKNNKDIKMANVAIVTSRELNNVNLTEFFPSGSIGLQKQKFSSPAFGPSGIRYSIYQSVANVSWEIDIFGKNLDRYKAGKLRFFKEMQLYKTNALRVAAEITQNYFALKATQKQISNLEEILEAQEKLTKIARSKEKNGLTSKTEIYKARIQYDDASSELIAAKTSEKVIIYRLAVLLGTTPDKALELLNKKNRKEIFDYNSGIMPVGLKSDVLKRRADILAAEYEIDAALYDKSAQFKEFFPSFNISGIIGGGNKSLGKVLNDPTNVQNITGGFTIPIFSYGSLLAQYKISKASAKNAVLNYEKTVIEAIADCESQLINYVNALKIERNSNDAALANKEILQIVKNKKRLGVATTEEVLMGKIAALNSENILAQKKSNSLTYLIALHKSLGGGFEGYKMKFDKDRVSFVKKDTKNDKK